jgi:hypothetical protein
MLVEDGPVGKVVSASHDVSDGRSARSGVSNGRSHLRPYARPRRHFSHMFPVFGGPAMRILTTWSSGTARHASS